MGMKSEQHYLLGQLGSFGDCLYATAVARQIKHDFPGCTLTWAIGSAFRSILDGNPFVDAIWEIPFSGRAELDSAWRTFEPLARRKVKNHQFDRAFFTQLGPNNYQNFDGTIRASIFRGYPFPVTVPVTPVLRLSPGEIETVRRFASEHHLGDYEHVILMECAPESQQSFVTPAFAIATARSVLDRVPHTAVILSSSKRLDAGDARILDGSVLSFRETPELTKYCSLLVGCSSGISWACTSDCAKPIPTIQLLKRSSSVFASMAHDADEFGLSKDRILEMTEHSPEEVAECVLVALRDGFPAARKQFHEEIPVKLDMYLDLFMLSVLKQGQPLKVACSLKHVIARYGIQPFRDYLMDKFAAL